MKNNIIYIGNFSISKMDAQSQLVIGNSKIFKELGYKVTLIGNDASLVMCNTQVLRNFNMVEFDYYNFKFKKSFKGLLETKKIFLSVKKILDDIGTRNIAFIVCYGSISFSIFLIFLSNWVRKNKIPIIYNCADIPNQRHGTFLEQIIKNLDRLCKHWIIRNKMDGLISVSDYIKKYFSLRKPSVVIPPLRDTRDLIKPQYIDHSVKKLVYIGVPFPIDGRKVNESSYKDRIDLFIDLIGQISDKVPPFYLDIYGLTKEEYLSVVRRHSQILIKLKNYVRFHGRIKHSDAVREVSQADYSVVYRINNKTSKAGFSTKFVESISCGTPVIMTEIGEYSNYVDVKKLCCILDINNSDKQRDSLINALSLDSKTIYEIKNAAFECHAFDYRNYIKVMEVFLRQVVSNYK